MLPTNSSSAALTRQATLRENPPKMESSRNFPMTAVQSSPDSPHTSTTTSANLERLPTIQEGNPSSPSPAQLNNMPRTTPFCASFASTSTIITQQPNTDEEPTCTTKTPTPPPDEFFPIWVRDQYSLYSDYQSAKGDHRISSFTEGIPDKVFLKSKRVQLVRGWDSERRLDKIQLTNEEVKAFEDYMLDSEPVNKALITNEKMTKDAAHIDRLLTGVFLRAKDIQVSESVITYKGLRSKKKEHFLGKIEVGSIVTPNYFFSTTTDEALAKRYFLSISTGCNKILKINGKSGLSLIHKNIHTGWSSGEQEVLYMKGTHFKITGVCDRADGITIIEMEEVYENQ